MTRVLDNRDPLRLGRILTADGWLYPLGISTIPEVGDSVLADHLFYIF